MCMAVGKVSLRRLPHVHVVVRMPIGVLELPSVATDQLDGTDC